MCNLYSMSRTRDEMGKLLKVLRDRNGNAPPLPGVFPDYAAPVVRLDREGAREALDMRWGFPPPTASRARHVTNVRNVQSSWWRPWLQPRFRCLVPATSFCEYDDRTKVPHWFALDASRPLFCFAGLWRPWTGVRRKAEGAQEHLLFAILLSAANTLTGAAHAQAMPVILTTEEDRQKWLSAPAEEALQLQRPAPDETLRLVATGSREGDPLPG